MLTGGTWDPFWAHLLHRLSDMTQKQEPITSLQLFGTLSVCISTTYAVSEQMMYDKTVLAGKLQVGGLRSLTKGERISAVKQGIVPPIRSERERQLRSRYGLTLEDYDALFQAQDGKCASCKKVWGPELYVDHDH